MKKSGLLIIFLLVLANARANDTLRISLKQADSLFLVRNYYLLAAEMNIEAQKAQVLQARLYPNPVFTADINAYDPEGNKAFHIGKSGQKVFQVDQLIVLGGKRKSEIEMARTNVAIAELEFQSLIRQLKYKLHTELYTIGQQQYLLQRYATQMTLLDSIMASFTVQVSRGNIPLKDLVRLKGVYLNLNNDRAELLKQYFESQANVQVLLQTASLIEFDFSDEEIVSHIKNFQVEDLIEEALVSKPEVAIIRQNKILAQQYYQYQRRLAVPDINAFASYDQRGGAFNNQINTGIAIPLPLWHRNQGNIKTARYHLSMNDFQLLTIEQELLSAVKNQYLLYDQTVKQYQKAAQLYDEDFEITVTGMSDNFQKRNVSLIEFVDFFEAYNDVLAELARIKTQLILSAEQLNLLIGKDLY